MLTIICSSINLDTSETERSGIVSSSALIRRRKKCLWITSILAGLMAVTIIAVTIRSRNHIKAVAEALVKRENVDSSVRSQKIDSRRKITFTDYLKYTFYAENFNGTWLSDTEILYSDQVLFFF